MVYADQGELSPAGEPLVRPVGLGAEGAGAGDAGAQVEAVTPGGGQLSTGTGQLLTLTHGDAPCPE